MLRTVIGTIGVVRNINIIRSPGRARDGRSRAEAKGPLRPFLPALTKEINEPDVGPGPGAGTGTGTGTGAGTRYVSRYVTQPSKVREERGQRQVPMKELSSPLARRAQAQDVGAGRLDCREKETCVTSCT